MTSLYMDNNIAEQAVNAMNENPDWDKIDNDENYNVVVTAAFEAFDTASAHGKDDNEALDIAYWEAKSAVEKLVEKN